MVIADLYAMHCCVCMQWSPVFWHLADLAKAIM